MKAYTESEMHQMHAPVIAFRYPFAYYNSGDPHDPCPSVFTCEADVRRELEARGEDWPVMAVTGEYILLRSVDCKDFDDIASLEKSLDGYDEDDGDYSAWFRTLDKLRKAAPRQ